MTVGECESAGDPPGLRQADAEIQRVICLCSSAARYGSSAAIRRVNPWRAIRSKHYLRTREISRAGDGSGSVGWCGWAAASLSSISRMSALAGRVVPSPGTDSRIDLLLITWRSAPSSLIAQRAYAHRKGLSHVSSNTTSAIFRDVRSRPPNRFPTVPLARDAGLR